MKTLLRFCVIAAALLFGIESYSITIYEISYEFKTIADYPKYTAILVRYDNGTGFMRVRYYKKDYSEIFVVNMEFDEIEATSPINGITYQTLEFKGKKPVYIMNTSSDKSKIYNPDLLWFKKLSTDKIFIPWGVTSPNSDGTYEQGTMTAVKLMNTKDLTKAYVRLYFAENESFYTSLFNPTSFASNNNTNTTTNTGSVSAKIHFIVVANTNDARIGPSVQKDMRNIYSEIKDVATFLNLPMVYTEVSGQKFGKKNVESALNALSPGPNDIVIFYYSGHGFSYDQTEIQAYPQLDLRESRFEDITTATLNASDIYFTIKGKNARLNLIITDCCNSSIGLLRPEGRNFAQTAKSLLGWNKSFCYNLFMQSKGSIITTAAKKGQFAYGNSDIGGYFTSNFTTAMEKYLSKFQSATPTWQQIVDEAYNSTIGLSLSNTCTAATTCRQDPVYYLDMNQ